MLKPGLYEQVISKALGRELDQVDNKECLTVLDFIRQAAFEF